MILLLAFLGMQVALALVLMGRSHADNGQGD